MINSIQDISNILVNNPEAFKEFPSVTVKHKDDLTIFSYNNLAVQGKWFFYEKVSRGLILNNRTGEVVAYPFDKFFNYGEHGYITKAPIKSTYEKLDGSLGILYRQNGTHMVATRGSFDSEQAIWATNKLTDYNKINNLPNNLTLMFEIIYPENRIVVDYKGREDLVLLGVRDRFTMELYDQNKVDSIAKEYGFNRPKKFNYTKKEELISILDELDGNEEGFVAIFEDGQIFKFKGKRYLELHKLLSDLSFKNTIDLVKNNTVDNILETIPDEFLDEFKGWVSEITNTVNIIRTNTIKMFNEAPKDNRKNFADFTLMHAKQLAPMMFAMLDGKDITQIIYKVAFND